MVFALLRRDWRMIGVETEAVAPDAEADLRLIDRVAPATLASWYLRSFSCAMSKVCNGEADTAMEEARRAGTLPERQEWLADADLLLRDTVAFIPITAPIRWSLVGTRVTGFQPNVFAQHAADRLVAERR
jgi:ABC-type transport system substrate-binding protein